MKNRIYRALAAVLICGFAAALFAGCGKKNDASAASGSPSAVSASSASASSDSASAASEESYEVPSSVSGTVKSEEGIVDSADENAPNGTGDASLPDYLTDSDDEVADDYPTDASYVPGEGIAVAPGTEAAPETGARELAVGETAVLESDTGSYELTVTSIALTDERLEEMPAPYVVKVYYTYKNISSGDDLLLGDLSFHMVDGNSLALYDYTFDLGDADANPLPQPVNEGESSTAVLGYVLTEIPQNVTLVFDDLRAGGSSTELYWKVSLG